MSSQRAVADVQTGQQYTFTWVLNVDNPFGVPFLFAPRFKNQGDCVSFAATNGRH